MQKIEYLYVLGGDTWALWDIVPCVVRHDNATEEDSENPTQITELRTMENLISVQIIQVMVMPR